MSIRPSSATDVARLMAELSSPDALRRETAVARLAVIGARAVASLTALAADTTVAVPARVASLQALEAIGDARASQVATALLNDPDAALATAAIAVLGPVARGTDGRATRALERLASLALAREVSTDRRLAALAALEGLPDHLLKPVYEVLATDRESGIVARVTRKQAGVFVSLDMLADRELPDDPVVLAAVVREDADKTRVTVLRQLVDRIRVREQRAGADQLDAWMAIRGQVHQSLAARESRLALYDLREALEQAHGPLPVGFLAAAAAIGDAACLEPLAAAWVAAPPADRWWRDHLAEAFRAIVKREDLTRRHKTLTKILEKWPTAGVLVAAARK